MNPSQKQSGAALIIVLWTVAIMGTLTMVFAGQSRLMLQVSDNIQDGLEAELIAEAGIYRMIGELVQDRDLLGADSLNEPWNNSANLFLDIPVGSGTYRLTHPDLSEPGLTSNGAWDESSKLNVNTATREQLQQLPFITEEIVSAIIDWRDDNETPEPLGAEAEYYMQLEDPYIPKNANFDSLDELLLVRDLTVELLYGEDTNRNGVLDANENDGSETFPIDNMDDELNMGWHAYLTCYSNAPNIDQNGEPRTNINSAEEETLQEALGDVLDEQAISRIIQARDEEEFESLPELLEREVSTEDDDDEGGNNQQGGGGGRNGNNGGGNNNNNNNQTQNVITRDEFRQILDRITISDETVLVGRVNINTAAETVLNCLLPEQEDLVARIIEYRESDDGPFNELGQLIDLEDVPDEALETLVSQTETKSNVFSIRSQGMIAAENTLKELYAIVDRGPDPPKIRYWKRYR